MKYTDNFSKIKRMLSSWVLLTSPLLHQPLLSLLLLSPYS